jgi:hypothetical protein
MVRDVSVRAGLAYSLDMTGNNDQRCRHQPIFFPFVIPSGVEESLTILCGAGL